MCLQVGEEVIQESELRELLAKKPLFNCYDGFEPSGRMHIAQGIMKAINVNKITSAGGIFIFWVADWFALLNNKMGGDLVKIQTVGRYFVEVWKAAGMNLSNVKFLWAAEEINKRPDEYWSTVIDISRKNNISRIKRCAQIMGRTEGDDMPCSQVLYPCMQCADIFFLKADICQLGMDQRKVNMLAREYCDDIGRKEKPIIISHHMLSGLKEGQTKMSKSDPDSAIFMEDKEDDVRRKIKKAFCPERIVEGNPILDYAKNIIFERFGTFTIKRDSKNGGDRLYETYKDLEADFVAGGLHPVDLKVNVADAINQLLQPVRDHFEKDPYAKKLLETIKMWQVTK
jgi:tyrosyl-tRNA synthetase